MRDFSRARHLAPITDSHDRHVNHGSTIVDELLPAAVHLTGAHAADTLAPVVAATGGELISCAVTNVQYRPQSDLVVRYHCEVRVDDVTTTDTLLAATTTRGPFEGTVEVEATTDGGDELAVGVWRWPFDPILSDLTMAVTPALAAEHLGELVGGPPALHVVAYRPTERAVIRVVGPDREVFVKVVPAATCDSLVERHDRLAAAGVPVPRVLARGGGWIAMEALHGTTLRDRLKQSVDPLPDPTRVREVLDALGSVDLPGAAPVRSRVDDAPHHARMLATVLPEARGRLDEIVAALREAPVERRRPATAHGDLHEAQLVVDDHDVTGLLDIDDVGPGDRLDDVSTLIAHLRFRAIAPESRLRRVDTYADAVRAAIAADLDQADVDRHVAAALVGLATGPFRVQHRDWAATTWRVLDEIERHLDGRAPAHAR